MPKPIYPTFHISQLSTPKAAHDILNAGRFKPYLASNPHLQVPHTHSFYHILFFSDGRGEHTIDFVRFPVRKGMIYFMRPGQVHNWHFTAPADGYIVNFSQTFFDQLSISTQLVDQFPVFGADVAAQVQLLDKKTQEQVKDIFEKIVSEQSAQKEGALLMIGTLLLQLLLTVSRNMVDKSTNPTVSPSSNTLRDFQQLIEAKFIDLRLPKDYAKLLFITPHQLNAACKTSAGISAGELIRNRVLLEAKRLLVNFSLPIGEIADRLNFPDHPYFIKFFKKHTGMTPEAFRKANYK